MKEVAFTVESNHALTADVCEMRLKGDTGDVAVPGQFIQIRLPELYLRRPISVCDWDGEGLTILFKVVGRGTAVLRDTKPGGVLNALTGLGNGYNLGKCGPRTVLIGGGVGVPPLYGLAKRLLAAGKTPLAVLGFNTAGEIFYEDEFRRLGIETTVTTVDGSYGVKGFVTNALPPRYDYFCACGPLPMLKAVWSATATSGQMSFEERMGCGFGACMGCSMETASGPKRVCRDGPVLEKEEILW